MNQIFKVTLVAIFSFLFSLTVFADNHIEAPTFVPIEGFACNYAPGKDMDDLMRVTKEWNDYVDDSDVQYNAWIFSTYFYSEEETADFFWIGASPTWEELGKAQALMMEPRGLKINEKFNSVTPCNDHTNWGYQSVRDFQSEDGDNQGVSSIVWCSLSEGATYDQLLAADKKFNEYADSLNMKGGAGRWYPGSGIPSRFDADFLWSQDADNHVEWGKSVDQAVNGGGNQVFQSIYGDLMTCSNRAVYNVTGVRASQQN